MSTCHKPLSLCKSQKKEKFWLDDFHELAPHIRLLVQIIVGCLMVWWGKVSLESLGYIVLVTTVVSGIDYVWVWGRRAIDTAKTNS